MTKSTISSQCSKLLKSDEQKIRLDITWSERINAGTTRVIGKYRKWLEENLPNYAYSVDEQTETIYFLSEEDLLQFTLVFGKSYRSTTFPVTKLERMILHEEALERRFRNESKD